MFRIIILFLNVFIVFGDDPIVETSHGIVQGKVLKTLYEEKKYYGFMGIPFAEPPVKELRFKAPREIDPWEGTLLATKEKPACIQFNNDVKKGQPLGQYGVEDCLYLDIFTPNIDENRRAVIVFIYNDRLQNSYNKSLDYAPDFFIEEDIVIVTPSHRLSTFGFLSFDDEHLPGNASLLDLYLSLKWIAKNIQRFGGDPDRITLMGSQGGAAAIDLLLHSKANELFHSAILQSGTSLTTMYLQDNVRERALKLRELLNIPYTNTEKILKDLQDTLPSIIFRHELQATPDNYNTDKQRSLLPFGPIVEKRPDGFITEYPENIVGSMKKPVMVVSDGTWGTATGDELCYLFKCPELRGTYLKYKRTLSQEFQIQRKMVKMWANFAKHSNPTPDENNPINIKWPTYESVSKQYLLIKENIEIGEKLLEERFKFWDDFMKKWKERAINEMARGNIKDEL
ncbi:carboxylesterase 5A-like [Colias croceus]|uniref:carboxylesterase 5A-like n=1 Tax=Colias crocea TaxID=72248 RepID=UPI001E27F5B6|nr:carboxylesterase 5A-like [Colias croceus]